MPFGFRPSRLRSLPHVKHHSREGELARRAVDDVDLAGVESGRQRSGGHLELEDGGLAVGCVQGRTRDDGRLVHLQLAPVEREARLQVRGRSTRLRRLVSQAFTPRPWERVVLNGLPDDGPQLAVVLLEEIGFF